MTKPTRDAKNILQLKGFDDILVKNLQCIGSAYLMASTHGVDMAIKSQNLCPESLDDSGKLWWPESGLWVDFDQLESIYAIEKSIHGAGAIECDFQRMPQGFTIAYVLENYRADLFELITDAHALRKVSVGELSGERLSKKPAFDCCSCCADRAERIRQNTENHPLYRILSMYSGDQSACRFHIVSEHVDMLCAWNIESVECVFGEIFCTGAEQVLRIDASMIHTCLLYTSPSPRD